MKTLSKLSLTFQVAGAAALFSSCSDSQPKQPNIVFVFVDEWRAQDIGYTGNPDVITPRDVW